MIELFTDHVLEPQLVDDETRPIKLKKKSEERSCLEAFTLAINHLQSTTFRLTTVPDDHNRNSKDVDAILMNLDGRTIAGEHSSLQLTEGFLEYFAQLRVFRNLVEADLPRFPDNTYLKIGVPFEMIKKAKKDKSVPSKLIQTVRELKDLPEQLEMTLEEMGYMAHFTTSGHPLLAGRCGIVASLKRGGTSKAAVERMLKTKLGKLLKYSSGGTETALVLDEGAEFIDNAALNEVSPDLLRDVLRVDYIFGCICVEGRVVVGNFWKYKEAIFSEIPYDLRFSYSSQV